MEICTEVGNAESRQLRRSASCVLRALGHSARVCADGSDLVLLPGRMPATLARTPTFLRLAGGAALRGQLSQSIDPAPAPPRPRLDEPLTATISVDARSLGRVRRAVAVQDVREALFAVWVDVAEGRLVAADGARMHVAEGAVRVIKPAPGNSSPRGFLLPAAAARLMALLRLETVQTDGRTIVARRQAIELFTEVAPGRFPDYRPCLGRRSPVVEVGVAVAADRILREVLRLCRSIDAARPRLMIGDQSERGTVLVASRNHSGTWPWLWRAESARIPAVVLDPVHLRVALAAAGEGAVIRLPHDEGPVIIADAGNRLFTGILQRFSDEASRA